MIPWLIYCGVAASTPDAIAGDPEAQPPSRVHNTPAVPTPRIETPADTPSPREQDLLARRITGGEIQRARTLTGAYAIGAETLEAYNFSDVHQILAEVPGLYVRDEEGFGLRPNIGLRGAQSDRSAKITLLEDGIPLAPAPYSAPAAYFFPIPNRMDALEVQKGRRGH